MLYMLKKSNMELQIAKNIHILNYLQYQSLITAVFHKPIVPLLL